MKAGARLSDAEVAIIGAGPAGVAAAIQLKRYGIEPLVFEKGRIGGLLWNANLVENYPGFPSGIPGPELVGKLEAQLRKASIDVIYEEVVRLEEGFGLKTEGGSYTADIVVVASGTEPRRFPGRISEEVEGRVFYEVYPLRDLARARVAVVGAGDAAFDYALNLARRNEVVLLNRGYKPKCLPLLWERARTTPSIAYREGVEVMEVLPSEGGVGLLCRTDGGEEKVEVDYVLFAIGRQPKLDFMSPELRGRTLERLHLIGDVKNGRFRQTAIAVGDGIRVAMEIYTSMEGDLQGPRPRWQGLHKRRQPRKETVYKVPSQFLEFKRMDVSGGVREEDRASCAVFSRTAVQRELSVMELF